MASRGDLEFQKFDNTGLVKVVESEIDIARGNRPGFSLVHKFGRNPDVDTATVPEDIWSGGGTYTGFPLGDDELVTITSSDVNDTAAGTGARTVRIYGLDSDGALQNEVLTLDGTNLVDSVNTYTRVFRAIVLTSGNSNQAFNAGNLSVAHKTTTSNIFLVVPAGTNQTQVAAYTIPAGKTGYFRHAEIHINRSITAIATVYLWVRENGASPRLIRPASVAQDDFLSVDIWGGLVFPALTDITVRVTSCSANNVEITCNFDILLLDD